jgi:hypothetical protein
VWHVNMPFRIQEAMLVGVSIPFPEGKVPVAIIEQISSEGRLGYHVGTGVQLSPFHARQSLRGT